MIGIKFVEKFNRLIALRHITFGKLVERPNITTLHILIPAWITLEPLNVPQRQLVVVVENFVHEILFESLELFP